MRLKARVDSNQTEIVNGLRRAGALVDHTHQLGRGRPDIICAHRGRIYWLEIKDGSKPKSQQKLTKDEVFFHLMWKDYIHVVSSIDEALKAIGVMS